MNFLQYEANPRKDCNSLKVFGVVSLFILEILSWSISVPFLLILVPRIFISFFSQLHFSLFNLITHLFNLSKTLVMFSICSSFVADFMIMSSRYAMQIFNLRLPKISSTILWKVAGALASPDGFLTNCTILNGTWKPFFYDVRFFNIDVI